MKKILFVIFVLFFSSCEMNYSVDMKLISFQYLLNENSQTELVPNYELIWKNGIPINYFKYGKTIEMQFYYSFEDIFDLDIKSIVVNIPSIDYVQSFYEKDLNLNLYRTEKKCRIDISLKDFMKDLFNSPTDFKKLKLVDSVVIIININENGKDRIIKCVFRPEIYRSFKVLDSLMSV